MYHLETKIKSNLPYFDDHQPEEGHEDRFNKKLGEYLRDEKNRRNLFRWKYIWKVAVVIFVLLVPSVIFFENHQVNGAAEYPAEYVEAKTYYSQMIRIKEQQIQSFKAKDSLSLKMKNQAIADIAAMKKQIGLLEQEFKNSSMDNRLFSALIRNYDLMAHMMDQVSQQINNTPSSE